MKDIFEAYVSLHGSFQTTENGLLKFDEFIEIYNLIESITKIEIRELRAKHEIERTKLFEASFINVQTGKMEEYIDTINQQIEEECDQFEPTLNRVLAAIGITDTIWQHSMDNLLVDDDLIEYCHPVALASPFVYKGDKTKEEILEIYKGAVEFALGQFGKEQMAKKDSFMSLGQYSPEDPANLVITFDFLIQDWVSHHHQMNEQEFKAAVSAFDLQSNDEFKLTVLKIV